MATAETNSRTPVRLNDVDFQILDVMADGKRYTQQYLYDDVPDLEEHSADWIRQRVSHLHNAGLLDKVGTSSMYVISDWGRAALELRDEVDDEISPQEFAELVRDSADSSARRD